MRLEHWLGFHLERWLQRGILAQLLLVAAAIVLVTLVGGLIAWLATPVFESVGAALWWAFLRLTDPGYLGDDEGTVLRVVSTVLTVLGYVLFMGSLIAIMTQWLATRIRQLEGGHGPISMQGHVVILGWTNRTPEIVRKLLSGEGRLDRFLREHGRRRLRIVILDQAVGAERRIQLRQHLRELWDDRQIFLRSGSALSAEHLQNLDIRRAAVVIVPGADFELGGVELTDTRVVKILLILERFFAELADADRPRVVAEVLDPQKTGIAQGSMSRSLEIVSSDAVITRLLSQIMRHRGVAGALLELLSYGQGSSIYVRGFPELAGATPAGLLDAFERATVMGVVSRTAEGLVADLTPASTRPLEPDDQLVLVASHYADCVPGSLAPEPQPPQRVPPLPPTMPPRRRRLLVLGWSHRIPALLEELGRSGGQFQIAVMSKVDVETRRDYLQRVPYDHSRVTVEHIEGDYAHTDQLTEAQPSSFDDIVLLASGWMRSSEEADARTILGYVLLRAVVSAQGSPTVTLELLDPDNERLFESQDDVKLISPEILSHMLAHAALRPEINAALTALFATGGIEIDSYPLASYGEPGESVSIAELRRRAQAIGHTAIGLRREGATAGLECELNPPPQRQVVLDQRQELIVLASTEELDAARAGADASPAR